MSISTHASGCLKCVQEQNKGLCHMLGFISSMGKRQKEKINSICELQFIPDDDDSYSKKAQGQGRRPKNSGDVTVWNKRDSCLNL